MKKIFTNSFLPMLLLTLLSVMIFRQFFFNGLYPIPANFMLAWYEPWKSDFSQNGVITLPHKPIADDVFRQIYPFKVLAMDIIKKGELPLWNPYNGAGQPLLATMHLGILNPLNLLFFIFEDIVAWSLQVVISVAAMGIATYLYCRKLALSTLASFLSAISCMFSGFIITRSIYTDYNYAFLCLPLLLYLIEDNWSNPKSRKILFFPIIIFFMCTVVQPQIIAYVLAFTTAYILFHYFSTPKKSRSIPNLFLYVILMIIGLGLAAIQLVPTIELFRQANVTGSSSLFIIKRFLLPLDHFVTLVIPNYFGNQATYNYWGKGDYVESIVSLGSLPVFFSMIGVATNDKRNKKRLFFIGSAIIPIIFSLNFFVTQFFYSLPVPIISTSVPSRILCITIFSLSILAGFGLDSWQKQHYSIKTVKRVIFLYALLLFFILCISMALFFTHVSCQNESVTNCRTIALRNTVLELGVFVSGLIGLFSIHYLQKKSYRLIAVGFLFVVLIASGVYNSTKFLPFSPKEYIFPSHPIINHIHAESGYNRVFGLGTANIKTNFATQYRFYDPNYYDPLYIKRYGEFVHYANATKSVLPRSDIEISNDIYLSQDKKNKRERVLSLLSVRTILKPASTSAQKISYSTNIHALPRAYIVQDATVITHQQNILSTLFSEEFNPKTSVILEEQPTLKENDEHVKNSSKILQMSENTMKIVTNASRQAYLVTTDTFYPGWKAYIDGKETKIYRANYTFRAIQIPKGKHTVLFMYKPFSFYLGSIISLSFLFLYCLLFFVWPKIGSQKKI